MGVPAGIPFLRFRDLAADQWPQQLAKACNQFLIARRPSFISRTVVESPVLMAVLATYDPWGPWIRSRSTRATGR
jgi:hypothetical protein